ncbi:MAG: hypothetical protein H2057_02065 [Alphaproteobacteria bacterium]|nr:hypothetical protein [Alphaproteobacteria bacterium]
MSAHSFMRKAVLCFAFFSLADKGLASSESALFETELSALRGTKATFASTFELKDLNAAFCASQALTKSITTHLTSYEMSADQIRTVEAHFTAFEINGMAVAKSISSALHHYETKAKSLTTSDTPEQESALRKAAFIYNQRSECSLLVEKLVATHNFYFTRLQAIKRPEDTAAWQSFDRINTCLNELTQLYWTAETSLVHTIVVDPSKFSPLWGYWNDEEKAAQSRATLFHLGRANVLGYLFPRAWQRAGYRLNTTAR